MCMLWAQKVRECQVEHCSLDSRFKAARYGAKPLTLQSANFNVHTCSFVSASTPAGAAASSPRNPDPRRDILFRVSDMKLAVFFPGRMPCTELP